MVESFLKLWSRTWKDMFDDVWRKRGVQLDPCKRYKGMDSLDSLAFGSISLQTFTYTVTNLLQLSKSRNDEVGIKEKPALFTSRAILGRQQYHGPIDSQ